MVLFYTNQLAPTNVRAMMKDESISMTANWTNKEHTAQRRPTATMYAIVCSLGETSGNSFTGRLGHLRSIDRQNNRH